MSQSPPNYMDGVPVKISEQYKPPPKVSLPQSIVQRLANSDMILSTVNYDFNLERNVLTKINEWDTVRQQERCDRRERMRLRQEERLKLIQEKQKQMLTAVSYPSAEDLSSDEDITSDNQGAAASANTNSNQENQIRSIVPQQGHFSPQNCFDTILVPTIVRGTYVTNYNRSLVNQEEVNQNHCNIKHTFNKINYSDFENDTSSPFDNVELKTINDLDILAQVLNVTKIQHSDGQEPNPTAMLTETTESNRSSSEEMSDENVTNENISTSQTVCNPTSVQNYNQVDHPNRLPTFNVNNYQNIAVSTSCQPNFNQYPGSYFTYYGQINPTQHQSIVPNEYSNLMAQTTIIPSTNPSPNYIYTGQPTTNSVVSPYQQKQVYASSYGYSIETPGGIQQTHSPAIDGKYLEQLKQQTHLKSKSVPDILKELNEEIQDSRMKRVRNNSQSNTGCSDGKKF